MPSILSENARFASHESVLHHRVGIASPFGALKPSDRQLEIVHLAEGIAVLSSWGCDEFDDAFIEKVLAEGFDGIEVFSPLIKKETSNRLLKAAKEHRLLISAGSDFHGPTHPEHYLGVTHCPPKALPLVEILTQASPNT